MRTAVEFNGEFSKRCGTGWPRVCADDWDRGARGGSVCTPGVVQVVVVVAVVCRAKTAVLLYFV